METLRETAFSQMKRGEFEEALASFDLHIAAHPADAFALQGRGLDHFRLKHWAKAIADFSKAKELNPDDLENWIGLGLSLAADLQIHPALDVLETLITAHPDFARGHIQLGLLYFRLCITAKGRRHFELARSCRPTVAERCLMEATLKDQDRLDRKRFFRPDFEALRAQ